MTNTKTPTITLLGNNSGRNLGDAAIMSAILDSFQKKLPDAKFLVPSIKPKFIDDNYGDLYNVKGINVMPWTGSIRLLGIPTIMALKKSDIAMICDGIIFGHKLFSIHNFLITLIFLAPLAKLFNCKLVCFCGGIGPFPTKLSERFAKYVLDKCDYISLRDEHSNDFAKKINVDNQIEIRGDTAYVNPVSPEEVGTKVLKENNVDPEATEILGLNITPYIDEWLEKDQRLNNKETFLNTVAEGIKKTVTSLNNSTDANDPASKKVTPVIFSCSPMDESFSRELGAKIGAPVIDNSKYLSHDIQSAMRYCKILLGMRFHSVVLASAVNVPVVGMVYAPKVRGAMALLESEEYSLELNQITPEFLSEKLLTAWNNQSELKSKQNKVTSKLRNEVRESVEKVVELLQ